LSLTGIFIRFFVSDTLDNNISKDRLEKYVKKMLFFSITISILTVMSSDLIVYIFGSKYEESLNILYILLVAFVLISVFSIYGNLLISNGFSKEYMISMFMACFINFILNIIFIPKYGIIAAAITTAVSSVITFITTYNFVKRKVLKL
jgi:O-antigen/teichoic acid export membrane protein